jgi:hypothetical protein
MNLNQRANPKMKEVVLELQTKRASNGLSKPTKPQKTMRDESGGQTFFGLPTHSTLARRQIGITRLSCRFNRH